MSSSSGEEEVVASNALLVATVVGFIFVVAVAIELFTITHGRSPFEDLWQQPGGWIGALLFFCAGAAFHEVLHALAWRAAAQVEWSELSVRRSRRKLGLITHLDQPVRAWRFRIGVVAPAAVLALLPIGTAVAIGNGLVLLWGLVFLFESFSDVVLLLAIRRVAPDSLVIELPAKLGCIVSKRDHTLTARPGRSSA